jgi:isopropylmalate/homocitrate/citramalate synthase
MPLADALAYAKGLGNTRAGVLETTFAEETETDLFGEQAVLCGGVSALVKAGFETLVDAGYQPEVAYFECMHELKLIVDLFYQGGTNYMRFLVSDTAEWGDYVAGSQIINEQARAAMKQLLTNIEDGTFAEDWIDENANNRPRFNKMRAADVDHKIEVVGRDLRRMMPFVNPREVIPAKVARAIWLAGDVSQPAIFTTIRGIIMQESHVRIFDTTLRDGEQAPGCTMSLEEKLEIARQLHRLGVDIIEAGFPAASPGDWAAVHQIAKEVGTNDGPCDCRLGACHQRRYRQSLDGDPTCRQKTHSYLFVDVRHPYRTSIQINPCQMLERARDMVRYARSLCDDIEFSPMDATRSDPAYLYEVLTAVVAEGATTLNIPDTVGFTTSEEYADLIRGILANVVGIEKCIISTHCHDDLGTATANSLAGVRAGARQVECTINGIGERAGNASLEEVVMALHTRQSFYQTNTKINTTELTRSSRLLSSFIGIPVPPEQSHRGWQRLCP